MFDIDTLFNETNPIPQPGKPAETIEKTLNIQDLPADTDRVEWFDDRYYKVNDELYPSVTTILSAYPQPHLAQWRGEVGNDEANKIMNEARERGSATHEIFEQLLHGKKAIYRGDSEPDSVLVPNQYVMLNLWKLCRWFEETRAKVRMTEHTVYSVNYEFAGTLDLLLEVPAGKFSIAGVKPVEVARGRYIADIKTGKSISDTAYMQLAAYTVALEEMTGYKIDGAMIIHTAAMTKGLIEGLNTKIISREELEDYFQNFLKVKAVFEISNSSKPKIFDLPNSLTLNI